MINMNVMSHLSIARCALLLLVLASIVPAQPQSGSQDDERRREREIARSVVAFLEQGHITNRPLEDRVGRMALQTYLEGLDPLDLYFLASDHEEFEKRATQIDDLLRIGETKDAHRIFARWLRRVEERVTAINRILKTEFDFKKDEVFVNDGDRIAPAKTTEELDDRWRRRLKLDLLNLEQDEVTGEEARDRLRKRYGDFLERLKKENREDVLSRWLNAFTTAYDPHTTYMSPKAYEDFSMGVTLNYHGIGAELGEEDGYVVIRRIIPGGAAEAEGKLKPGDKIAGVGQDKEGEIVDCKGMRSRDIVKLIRGEEGTFVRLQIIPDGGGATRVDLIERKKIQLDGREATSEIVDFQPTEDGPKLKVGVIDLPSFYRDLEAIREGDENAKTSTGDVRRFLLQYEKEGVDVAVLDLRTNGGGFLPEAVGVAGLFIDRGPIVQVKAGRRTRVLRDREGGVAWSKPVIVLTSGASASASEIVAGAIRDYGRGLVVGNERTHGKGTVQTTLDMAEELQFDGGAGSLGVIKLTLQQFYLPAGESTQVTGVPSDVILPSWLGVFDEGEGALPNALPADRIEASRFRPVAKRDAELLGELAARSKARIEKDPFWVDLRRRLQAYVRQRDSKVIPIAREAFQARSKELDSNQPDQEEGEGLAADPWFREVLRITADYHELLAARTR